MSFNLSAPKAGRVACSPLQFGGVNLSCLAFFSSVPALDLWGTTSFSVHAPIADLWSGGTAAAHARAR